MLDGLRDSAGRVSPWRVLPWAGLAVVALAVVIGYLGLTPGIWGQVALVMLFLICVLALRRDVWSAVVLVVLAIVQDWFQLVTAPHGLHFTALLGAILLLAVIFVAQRRERPWRHVKTLDLVFWGAFILLGLLDVPRSAHVPGIAGSQLSLVVAYFLDMFVGAFVFWALGIVLVRHGADLRLLCQLLAAFATLLAIHAIIQELTGVIIFETPYWVSYLARPEINDFRLAGGTPRATTFFMRPDMTESFFSSVVFLPLGLLAATRNWAARALYAVEGVAILLALLFTYGPVGWLTVAIGVLIFASVTVRGRGRVAFLGGLAAAGLVGGVLLRHEWQRLLAHATNPRELGLRSAIWRTALNVIRAHPLLGVGLGEGQIYQVHSQPYLDASLTHAYPNPQNTFLELAAFVGIPALLAFLCILGRSLWGALDSYRVADGQLRPVVLGAGLVVLGLCINGLSDPTFAVPPLVPIGYLLLGAVASPRLRGALRAEHGTGDPPGHQFAPAPVRYGPPMPEGEATPGARTVAGTDTYQ